MKRRQRQLVFHRGDELYVFRWEDGREEELLDALADQRRHGRAHLDGSDMAVLRRHLTRAERPLPRHELRHRRLPPPAPGL